MTLLIASYVRKKKDSYQYTTLPASVQTFRKKSRKKNHHDLYKSLKYFHRLFKKINSTYIRVFTALIDS